MSNEVLLAQFQAAAEPWLFRIEKLISPTSRLTLIVRTPGHDEADIVLTKDDLCDVAALIERRRAAAKGGVE